MESGPLALCLIDPDNEFQQVAARDAEAAAGRAGLPIEVHWSGLELAAQLAQLREVLDQNPRPRAVLVMAVRDRGLRRLADEATEAGIHWVFLNRSEDDTDEIRRRHPGLAVCQVYPDEVETGRVQGKLVRALLPKGGRVLHVQGSTRSLAALDRTSGMAAVLADGPYKRVELEAGWTAAEGRNAALGWLRIGVQANIRVDLVACHTDLLATGVREALEAVASEHGRPDLVSIPVVGCDGTPSMGQAMVRDGRLAATVVLPRSSGPAVDLVATALAGGPVPPPVVTLRATPFPPIEEVVAR